MSRSFHWNWWLEAHRTQVLVLSARLNTMENGDSNLLAVTAGPLCEVVVSVSEGLVYGLHSSIPDRSSLLTPEESKSTFRHRFVTA